LVSKWGRDLVVYSTLLSVFTLSVGVWFLVADVFLRMVLCIGLALVFLDIDFYMASRGRGFLGAWAIFLVLALLSASMLYGVGLGISYFVSYTILIVLWLKMFPGVLASLRSVDWRWVIGAAFLSVFILGYLGFDGVSMVVLSPLWEFVVWRGLGGGGSMVRGVASSLFSSSTLVLYPVVLIYSALSNVFRWKAGLGLGTILALDIALRTCVVAGWLLWM